MPARPSARASLHLDDEALLRQCREERYRSGGPGGQRRNKVETAVRLRHPPSGLTAFAEEGRHLAENRKRALRRLRHRIALEVRQAPGDPLPASGLSVNPRNPRYPLVLASVLDALDAAGGSYAGAGRLLGVTTSQVVRFLRADAEAWRHLAQIR